jgi:lysozyme
MGIFIAPCLSKEGRILMTISDPAPRQTDQTIIGVDISHWQANISHEKLAYHGMRFVIMKAGEVPNSTKREYTDVKYARNMFEARKNGMITGAYYYFHPTIGASRQARHFDSIMEKHGYPDLPPVIDVEDTNNLPPVKVAAVLKAMIDGMVERGYRQPIIYSRWGFLVNQVGEPPWLKDHLLWLAHYNPTLSQKPRDMSNVILWQYTNKLRLAGIGVDLDGNYWLKSEKELLDLAHNPPQVVEPEVEVPVEVIEPQPEPEIEFPPAPPVEIEDDLPEEQLPEEWPPLEDEVPAEPPVEEPMPVPVPSPLSFWQMLSRFISALLDAFGYSSNS